MVIHHVDITQVINRHTSSIIKLSENGDKSPLGREFQDALRTRLRDIYNIICIYGHVCRKVHTPFCYKNTVRCEFLNSIIVRISDIDIAIRVYCQSTDAIKLTIA